MATPNSRSCWGGISEGIVDNTSTSMGLSETFKVAVDERFLADMNAMTVEERELVYEEVHGVSDIVEETPELLTTSLQRMRDELAKVPKYNRKALDRALFLKPTLESDDNFHVMFLRAERFDPFKAALKMYRYFEHKLNLFGDEKLVRRITLDDLGRKEKSLMYSGAVQFLLTNDSSGRAIFLLTPPNYDVEDPKAFLRYSWYQELSVLEENEEIQKRGIVQIINLSGSWQTSAGQLVDFLVEAQDIPKNWPFRICASHLCHNQPIIRRVMDTFFALVGKEIRIRQRAHHGSALETRYALLTFGIVLPNWFTSGDGTPSREYIEIYLAQCQKNEAAAKIRSQNFITPKPGLVLHPDPQDILLGRGRPFHSWYGNVHLLSIVEMYAERYMKTNEGKGGKSEIAMEIVEIIRSDGGNFLQRGTTGFWEIVSQEVAKEKVSQIMRAEIRKRQNSRHPGSSSESSLVFSRQELDSWGGGTKRHRIQ